MLGADVGRLDAPVGGVGDFYAGFARTFALNDERSLSGKRLTKSGAVCLPGIRKKRQLL
jgi:hypothetical protein